MLPSPTGKQGNVWWSVVWLQNSYLCLGKTKEKKREKSKKLEGLGELRGKRDQIEGSHRAVARRGREQIEFWSGKGVGFRFVLFASTLLRFLLVTLLQATSFSSYVSTSAIRDCTSRVFGYSSDSRPSRRVPNLTH